MSVAEARTRCKSRGFREPTVKLSKHFRERWSERGDSRLPREAVQLAPKVNIVSIGGKEGYDADEVRVYAPGDNEIKEPLAFLIRDGTAITATPLRKTALPYGMKRCEKCGGAHLLVTSTGCPYCSMVMYGIQREQWEVNI